MPFTGWIENTGKWLQTERGYALLLFLTGFLVYLYPLNGLGFYWDDWEVVYLTRLATPQILEGYFFFDRPLAWTYPFFYALIGSTPFFWHLLSLVLRWVGTYFFYRTFSLLWTGKTNLLRWFGLLLLAYPAFLQQPIATAFSRHFTAFALCGLSFFLTALALRGGHKNLLWLLAFLTGAAQIFTIEYFAGLELVRPVLVFMLLAALPWRERIKRTIIFWIPFVAAFGAFAWWRVGVYPTLLKVQQYASGARLLTELRSAPVDALFGLARTILIDASYLLVKSWIAFVTDPARIDLRATAFWFAMLMGLGLAGLAGWSYRVGDQVDGKFPPQAILLGLAALACGGVPVWMIGRAVAGGGMWDNRFAISMMVGAVLASVGLVDLLVKSRWQTWFLAGLLVLSITTQVVLVNGYRRDWSNLRDFFWQLYWRAPGLQAGTPVLARSGPSANMPDYDMSFAMALLYAGQPTGIELPYWYYKWEVIEAEGIKPGKNMHRKFRNLEFDGVADHSLVMLAQPAPGCLRILSPMYADDPRIFNLASMLPYADPGRILPQGGPPPLKAIFGREPAHTWCYYFEKADLAAQLGQWEQVKELYAQAEEAGYSPSQGGEYLPLVEALAQGGNFKRARQVSQQAAALTGEMNENLCANWARYARLPGADAAVIRQVQSEFACP